MVPKRFALPSTLKKLGDDGANLTERRFTVSDLERTTFAGATMNVARDDGLRLAEAVQHGSRLRPYADCDLRGLRLSGQDFSGMHFVGARFVGAGTRLSGADLRGSRYCHDDERDCRPVTATELRSIASADLTGARIWPPPKLH